MTLSSAPSAAALSIVPPPEEVAMRAAVHDICASFGPRYAQTCHERNEPPTELWAALGEKGFIGASVPQEWGGGGLGMSGLQIVAEEMAATGNATLMLVASPTLGGSLLARHGTPAQKERWLRGIAAGSTRFSFAITEPDAGTNTHDLRTEMRRDGDRYRLSGQKTFISGIEDAHAVLVVARMRRSDGTLGAPCLCVVDADAPGLTRNVIAMPYLGPDRQSAVFFDDVVVERDRLVGGEEGGLAALFDGLNPERVVIAALANGIGRLALDKAAAYARERVVWKTPIGAHQGVAHPLAKAKIELELARLMTQKAAALVDADAPGAGEAANMAKYAAAEAAIHCVDAAVQTHGGNGLALDYGVSDLWWPARLFRTAPVCAEMILNYVAQHSLGLPRSY